MAFETPEDIANRALQHCGAARIVSLSDDSRNASEVAFVYDKVRRAELRRNTWRFATRKVALRPLTTTTLLYQPATWNGGVMYLPGSIVLDPIDGETMWLSMSPDNINNPPGAESVWQEYFGPLTADQFFTACNPGGVTQGAYFTGELTYIAQADSAFVVYASLVSSNTDVPNVPTPWSATETYNQDASVSYNGFQWRSLIALNLNNPPANGPAAYVAATIYSSGQMVTGSDGFQYTSVVNSNLGNDPTLDNGANWTTTFVPTAWASTPPIYQSDQNWLPIYGGLTNLTFSYPIGSGPMSQSGTKNVYRLPAGFLREAPQDPKQGSYSWLGAPAGLAYNDWTYEGNYFTSWNSDPIIFRFVADVQDVTQMDDMFCEGFAARIAMEICEILTQSSEKLTNIVREYNTVMHEARTVNMIETGPVEPPVDEYLAVRM